MRTVFRRSSHSLDEFVTVGHGSTLVVLIPPSARKGHSFFMTLDISPVVEVVCNRFDAANDLVLEHVNSFLDLSPKWSLMRAALAGHLHLVQRLSRRNPNKFQRCCQEAMDSAAEFGHLQVVHWLHYNRKEGCTTDAMDMAASNGHLDIVQWLHDNRTEGCTANAMDFAAQHGHLQVVQWLHSNRKEGATHYAIDNAATCGHLEVIRWLHAHRDDGCSQSAVVNAISAGHADVARWLVANRSADCVGKLGFVEYLSRRGFWDVAALTTKYPFLQELVDVDMFMDEEEDQVLVREMEELEFLRLWNTGLNLHQ